MAILLLVGILVLLIVVHELGHFFMAKFTKVRVDEFGVGYPPRAFLLGKIGKTEYTLNWLPFGGFVRLYGDNGDADGGAKGSLAHAKPYVQALILVSGVAANAILAWFLFASSFVMGVPTLVQNPAPNEVTHLFVTDVVSGSPAAGSGLSQGDEILTVVDDKGVNLSPLSVSGMTDFIKDRGGKKITVTFKHNDSIQVSTMQPANAVVPGAPGRPALGVGLALVSNRVLNPVQALYEGFFTTVGAFLFSGKMLWTTLSGIFTAKADFSQITGPVGLIYEVHLASENGFGNVIRLAAFISVNLAIINLIPIPILDGGKLVILAFETLRRKKLPLLSIQLLNGLSLVLVASLMIAVTYHDIVRIFH